MKQILKSYSEKNGTPHSKDTLTVSLIEGEADACCSSPKGTKVAPELSGRYPCWRACRGGHGAAPRDMGGQVLGIQNSINIGLNLRRFLLSVRQSATHFTKTSSVISLTAINTLFSAKPMRAYCGRKGTPHYHRRLTDGDAHQPTPPTSRLEGRNHDWRHLYNRDIISLPDAWEYPWYAAWDSAFHMIPMARIDPAFAKDQLILFLREWYMHPNGQIPAYGTFDVNESTGTWSCWQVYLRTGRNDRIFGPLFPQIIPEFPWWINRKDPDGHNLFAGGFLGLDNIGIFDRSKPLPGGGQLRQADGTAWIGFFCAHVDHRP